MPPPSIIEVILSMRNVGAFVSQADEASTATARVGKSAEAAGKGARAGALGLIKYAAGAAAVYGAVKFIDHAVTSTEALAVATYKFQQQTGASATFASEFISATGEMGITSKQVAVSFQTFSKQIAKASGGTSDASKKIAEFRHQIDLVAAAGGQDAPKQMAKLSAGIASAEASSEKARKLFDQFGVSQKDLAKGNTPAVMLQVADAFKTMRDPATKAADAQLLFGRSGYKLIPVLNKGREGVQKWLEAQKEAGNYLDEKGVQSNLKAIKQQKELAASMHGLETQLALALLPALIAIGGAFLGLAKLLAPITTNATRLKVVIYGLVGALIAWKTQQALNWLWAKRNIAASVASAATLQALALQTWAVEAAQKAAAIATEAWTAAMELLNAAFVPLLIVAALVAIGVAIYEAYKHVKVFRDAVNATWQAIVAGARWLFNWLKANWPYLVGIMLGPFGIVAAAVYKHFDAIKSYAVGIIDAIRSAIRSLVNWVETLPGKLGGLLKKIPGVGLALKAGHAAGGIAHAVGLQHGGTVTQGGGFLVGERGPELVSLPAGAFVRPTPDTASVGHGRDLVITVPIVLDRKVLAQAVARVASDQLARR